LVVAGSVGGSWPTGPSSTPTICANWTGRARGVLPGERLRGFVPRNGAGVLEEYGTMLDPGRRAGRC
ncbi:hypothetical protein GA0115255_103341, partial [Streptomyces sp. Ncost-T6T-2b]